MAIKISGTTVIDDSKNIVNANDMIVGVVTMTGSTGDIETPGTITAGGLDFPISVVSFSPADGATDVDVNQSISITFDQVVEKPTTGIGTTANITLRNSSGIGTVIQTIGVNSTSVTTSGAVVTIDPPSSLPYSTNVYVVVDEGAFINSNIGSPSPLIDTYDFTTTVDPRGSAFEGGYLICLSAGVYWIAAPNAAAVSTTWYDRNSANTSAQSVSGCTGWFVPSCGQLQNPGFICRTFWESLPGGRHWSNTEQNATRAWYVDLSTGVASYDNFGCGYNKSFDCSIRSFRCVTY